MTVEVIVPYWGADPVREANLKYVVSRLRAHSVGNERIDRVTVARRRAGPAPKGAVVWPAIKRSKADMLVLHDADVWCDGLGDAVAAIDGSGEWQWGRPHRDVIRLAEDSSAYYREHHAIPGRREVHYDRTPYRGVTGGGVVIAKAELLREVAIDPRFEGWGQEDIAHGNALWTLYGPPYIGAADLIHLYHEPSPRLDGHWGSEQNRALYTRYHNAAMRPDTSDMLALVAEAHHALEAR